MNKVHFSWDIHYKCNFRCPYCWFFDKWESLEKLNIYLSPDEWYKIWKRIYQQYGECHIMITGGEPTIYPNFFELIEKLSQLHTIKITTNLSIDMTEFVKKISPERVSFDWNFHPLETNLELFISNIMLLRKYGFKGGVCCLAYPPFLDKIKYYEEIFKQHQINFALAAFWGQYQSKTYPYSYTEEEIKLIVPYIGNIERIRYHLQANRTKGKLCNAGYIYASIKANGNVTRCGPLSDKPIGNIFDHNFKLLEKPTPCESEFCPCDEYVYLEENK